jgi:hypothetical protein
MKDGEQVPILSKHHPNTAKFISTKIGDGLFRTTAALRS